MRTVSASGGQASRLFYSSFGTAIGQVLAAWGPRGLLMVSFPDTPEKAFFNEVRERFGIVPIKGRNLPGRAEGLLKRYFSGKKVDFSTLPLDLTQGTAFQQAVWRKLMEMPYGEVRSYGWVAREIGRPRAVRAVGRACGQNPLPPIVPCHRVVGSNGGLTGYSGRGGIRLKERLLELEGAAIHMEATSQAC